MADSILERSVTSSQLLVSNHGRQWRSPFRSADRKAIARQPSVLEKRFVQYLYRRLGEPEIAIAFWDGTTIGNCGDRTMQIVIHHPAALRRLVFDAVTGFGEAYMDNEISVDGDLIDREISLIEKMFDSKFVRMWRLYLAASSAAFQNGDLQLFQVVFVRSSNNTLPWTRADLYSPAP